MILFWQLLSIKTRQVHLCFFLVHQQKSQIHKEAAAESLSLFPLPFCLPPFPACICSPKFKQTGWAEHAVSSQHALFNPFVQSWLGTSKRLQLRAKGYRHRGFGITQCMSKNKEGLLGGACLLTAALYQLRQKAWANLITNDVVNLSTWAAWQPALRTRDFKCETHIYFSNPCLCVIRCVPCPAYAETLQVGIEKYEQLSL